MKYLKNFKNHSTNESIKDKLYNASTTFTGKPKIWEILRDKSYKLTKEVVKILINKGYDLTDQSGVMTDSSPVWSIQDKGMQPIVISPKYNLDSKNCFIDVQFYFSTNHEDVVDNIEIDESNLELVADKVAESIEKLRSFNNKGNIFSKQGNIKIIPGID